MKLFELNTTSNMGFLLVSGPLPNHKDLFSMSESTVLMDIVIYLLWFIPLYKHYRHLGMQLNHDFTEYAQYELETFLKNI
jgi:hypothetical protein